jgi:hypothetical protein
MNLEQIVKETVAKIVAEKQGKDLTGDGKIDSADYLQARSNAIEKAKGLDEDHKDHEVSMAQSSLNSILRSAMELKAKIGGNEIDIPAWIQDHITNSENFIDQASQGYHEYSNGGHESEEMNEARVSQDNVVNYLANALQSVWNAGKGNNSIDFQDFAQSLYFDMFGGDEMNEANLGHNEISKIEQEGRFWIVTYSTANGTKEKSFESEDEARKFYNGLDEVFKPKSSFDDYSVGDNVTVAGKKAKITNMKMDDETGERRARVKFEDGTVKEVNMNSLDETQLEEAMANRQNIAQIVAQKYGNQLSPIRDKYRASNEKWSQSLSQYGANSSEFKEVNKSHSEIANGFKNAALNAAAREMKIMGMSDTQIRNYFSEYGPFEDWVHDYIDELIDALDGSQQNENKMTTNEGRSAEDIKQAQIEQAYSHLEKIKEKPKLFSSEDIKKAEARIDKLEAELDALAAKAANESLDEATVRRWQHYAGIK